MRAETGSNGIAPGGSIVPASFPVGATFSLPLQPIERERRADTTHACLNLDAMGLLLSEGSDLGLYEPTLPPPELRARFSARVPLYSSSAGSEILFPGRRGDYRSGDVASGRGISHLAIVKFRGRYARARPAPAAGVPRASRCSRPSSRTTRVFYHSPGRSARSTSIHYTTIFQLQG